MLDGSRSSKEVVVFDHFLIDLGVMRLEGGFEECLSLEIGIYLFLQARQLCILLVEETLIVLPRYDDVTGGTVFDAHCENGAK